MKHRLGETEMDRTRAEIVWCMARLPTAVLLAGIVACSGPPSYEIGPPPEVPEGHGYLTVEGVGLQAPQSILHDPRADIYLVGNVAPGSDGRPSQGFISRIKPDGEVETLRWVDGARQSTPLHAPMGMAIRGDTLLVADLDCVRLFHRTAGDPLGSICTAGPAHLNDVTVDRHGVAYATAGGTEPGGLATGEPAVYAIDEDHNLREILGGRGLGYPHGISGSPRGVFFCGYDSGTVSQVTPDGPRRVLKGNGWHVSGIVFTRDGSFAFSNAKDSTVILVRAKDGGSRGDVFTLVRNVPGSGDLGYDGHRERILIPQAGLNRLLFVDLWP